jgi:hypothetical protein
MVVVNLCHDITVLFLKKSEYIVLDRFSYLSKETPILSQAMVLKVLVDIL